MENPSRRACLRSLPTSACDLVEDARELDCTGPLVIDAHSLLECREQLGAVLLAHDRVATVSSAGEEIRRRHPPTDRRHYLEARAGACEVHDLELRPGQVRTSGVLAMIQHAPELDDLQP